MTIITVTTAQGRLSPAQRRELALSLTDAVLVPEVGQHAPAARIGFQVHFVERARDSLAIGGHLLSDRSPVPDVATIDICVMDAAWSKPVRKRVIEGALKAMANVCGLADPAPCWWATFRVIDEGSWGSRGAVQSILDLLDTGVFEAQRAAAVGDALRAGR